MKRFDTVQFDWRAFAIELEEFRKNFLRPEFDEPNRLRWHITHVIINSKKISIITFDELYEALAMTLQNLKDIAAINV